MSTDTKLSKAQISKIFPSGECLGKMVSAFPNLDQTLAKYALTKVDVPLAKDVLPGLVSNMVPGASSNAIDKLGRKITGHGTISAAIGFTFFNSNEDMDDIIKIGESLEKSGLLIDGAHETVKHEIKKQEGGFLPAMVTPMSASLILFIDTTCGFFIYKCYNRKRN